MGKVYGNVNDVFACYKGVASGEEPKHMIVMPNKKVRELDPYDIQNPEIAKQVNQRNTLDKWWEYEEVPPRSSSSSTAPAPAPSCSKPTPSRSEPPPSSPEPTPSYSTTPTPSPSIAPPSPSSTPTPSSSAKPTPSSSATPPPSSSATPPPSSTNAQLGWSIEDGQTMRELITKSQLIRSTLTLDDVKQIATGKWSEYPESKGTLTDAEINAAKKLLENDAALFKKLDTQANGSLNAYELLMGNTSQL